MGKEFPLAREEEEGQPVLLAIPSSGEHVTVPSIGDEGTQVSSANRGSYGRKTKNPKTESQGSRKDVVSHIDSTIT